MLNIIIPSFNDEQGLYTTLFSLGTINYNWKITIIDDNSTNIIHYNTIIDTFKQFYPIEVIKSKSNIGPGGIRQLGINNCICDYIMFIDCGDKVLDPRLINYYVNFLDNNKRVMMTACAHYIENENYELIPVGATHTMMHGKIYRLSFIKDNNIKFNLEHSFLNEDVGFNTQCQILAKVFGKSIIFEDEENYMIIQTYNENSLTKKNNNELYKNYIIDSTANLQFAINNIKEIMFIPMENYADNVIDVFVYMYIMYLNNLTLGTNKNILTEIYQFYNLFKEIIDTNEELLKEHYYQHMLMAFNIQETFVKNLKIVSFNDFLNEIKEIGNE